MIFTDEWGGGVRPRCRATDLPNWGADAIFDIVDHKLHFASYYKMPAPQTDQENCVAHNGSLIPVPGRDIMVQAWYQGGVSVFDFTDSAKPVEIAYFDRGPIDRGEPDPGRVLVGLLVQRPHLRFGDCARPRRVHPDAERVSVPGRDCRRVRGPPRRVQRPAAAAAHVARDAGGRPRVPRSAHAEQGRDAGDVPPRSRRHWIIATRPSSKSSPGSWIRPPARAAGRDAARLRSLSTTLKGLRGVRALYRQAWLNARDSPGRAANAARARSALPSSPKQPQATLVRPRTHEQFNG